jgi:hypothetical protein
MTSLFFQCAPKAGFLPGRPAALRRNETMLDENGSQLKEGDDRPAQEFNIRFLHQVRWSQQFIAQALGVSTWKVNKIVRQQKTARAA